MAVTSRHIKCRTNGTPKNNTLRVSPLRVKAYALGEGYPTTSEGKPVYAWPYSVHYTPDCERDTFLNAAQVLLPQWRADLLTAGVEWLLPLGMTKQQAQERAQNVRTRQGENAIVYIKSPSGNTIGKVASCVMWVKSTPALDADRTLYVGTGSHTVYAIR